MAVVFLLGAGSPAKAGVPLMNRFVADLLEELDGGLEAVPVALVKPARGQARIYIQCLRCGLSS